MTLQADGSFSYVPAAGFNGTATFTYQADDGARSSNTATVTITVNAVNDPPDGDSRTATRRTKTRAHRRAANGVLGNDTDPDGARR